MVTELATSLKALSSLNRMEALSGLRILETNPTHLKKKFKLKLKMLGPI
jgi:hypothetical protein